MGNSYFRFKQFTIRQEHAAMKVTTDACLFGAWVAKQVAAQPGANHLLDVGTGTALLSLMIAQQAQARLDAIEIDEAAAEQAKSNAANSPWKNRIHIMQGDARVYNFTEQYDIIVSNPPFYENELSSVNSKKNTAHHSSDLLMSDLLTIISTNLKENGHFYLLLPFKRYEEIIALTGKHGLKLDRICLVKQSVDHPFFRAMIAGGKSEGLPLMEELAIKQNNTDYTADFTRLLKDYYLYL